MVIPEILSFKIPLSTSKSLLFFLLLLPKGIALTDRRPCHACCAITVADRVWRVLRASTQYRPEATYTSILER